MLQEWEKKNWLEKHAREKTEKGKAEGWEKRGWKKWERQEDKMGGRKEMCKDREKWKDPWNSTQHNPTPHDYVGFRNK